MATATIGQLDPLSSASSIASSYSEVEYSGSSYKANIGTGVISSGGSDSADTGRWELSANGKLEQWGWGYVQWSSGTDITEDVDFPMPFASGSVYYPDVICVGYKTTNPATIDDVSGTSAKSSSCRIIDANTIRIMLISAAAETSGYRFLYKWHAVGRAP